MLIVLVFECVFVLPNRFKFVYYVQCGNSAVSAQYIALQTRFVTPTYLMIIGLLRQIKIFRMFQFVQT